MLDNLVVERFREGHGNVELKKHLCLYPSTGLQDLIGACVRFETHVELGTRAYKQSNEGLYTVQGNDSADLTGNKGIEDSGDKTTMVDLAGTKMGEVLNKDPSSTRTGTVARAHRTLSGGRHRLER